MDDSAMDITSVCSSSGRRTEINTSVMSNEAIYQENHQLKKKVEVLEKFNKELESDINYLTQQQAKETTRLLNVQEELNNANSKIRALESTIVDEQVRSSQLREEINNVQGTRPDTKTIIVDDQEHVNLLAQQIERLEIERDNNQCLLRELGEEKDFLSQKLTVLSNENQALHDEILEIKEHLEQKIADVRNLNITIESLREEKLLMTGEIQLLKASDKNADRGNSLFAEVEENRQKMAAQRELLKIKYMSLKKMYNQKIAENNKLKLEIVKIRREDKDDEKGIHNDYNVLIETYKKRVTELEGRVKDLEKKAEKQPVFVSDSDNPQLMWVNSVVEDARKETKSLQEELDRRGSNYVIQGHQLFASQRENRKLKSTISKLQSDFDELKLQLDTIKSDEGNCEVKDGISPPATEVAIEYQKQKMVRFKEAVAEKVKNISKLNSSLSDPDASLHEQNKSLKETIASVPKIKEDNKENLGS